MGRRAGLSLVEMMIGLAIFAVLGGAAIMVGSTTESTSRAGMIAVNVDMGAGRGLQRISEILRNVRLTSLAPANVNAPFSASTLNMQRVIGYDPATGDPDMSDPDRLFLEPATGEVDDGIDNDGDGLVDEKRVVFVERIGTPNQRRVVVATHVRDSLEGETPGNGVDDNGNGLIDEPGFCVTYEGSVIVVRLTIERLATDGRFVTRTVERRIRLRNDG